MYHSLRACYVVGRKINYCRVSVYRVKRCSQQKITKTFIFMVSVTRVGKIVMRELALILDEPKASRPDIYDGFAKSWTS